MPLTARLLLALLALLGAASPTPASAHALLLRSEPAAGIVGAADQPPRRVALWFSEPVDVAFNAVSVVDRDGRRVDRLDARVAADDSRRVEVSLGDGLAQGAYLVRWRATSADNHIVSGTFWFGVGFAAALPPAALLSASTPRVPPLEATARWLALLAALTLAGAPFFQRLVRQPVQARLSTTRQAALHGGGHSLVRLWLAAATLFVVAHLVWAVAQIEAVAELPLPQALDGPVVRAVLLDSRFAALWWARLMLGAALLAMLLTGTHRRWLGMVLALLMLLAVSLGGHAAGARVLPPLAVAVDLLHLSAAAVWLGGLAQLSLLLPSVLRAPPADRAEILRRLVPRVSTVALVSVGLLVATGLFSAWEQAGALEAVVATAYGQSLLLKLALLVPLLGTAAVNLLVVRPRAARARASAQLARGFRRLVMGEVALGGGVLLVVGLLTSLPPPGPQGLPGPIDAARQAGDLRVRLSVDPNWVGVSQFRVELADARGQPPPDVRDVILTFAMEGMNMGRTTVVATALTPGVFEANGFYVGMPGISQIGVAIARTAGPEQSAVFRIEVPSISERQFQGLRPALGLPVSEADQPPAPDAASLARGRAAYEQHCALCHGDTGIGNGPAAASLLPPPADLTLHARWHADDQLFWFITHGVAGTPMPAFADQLSPAERWDVIAYLHALAEAPTATAPREAPAAPPSAAPATPAPARGELTGRLVFGPDSDKDFWVWHFPAEAPERLTHFGRLDFASHPVWAPDGKQIAFSYYQLPRVGAIPAGTDLYLMDADGSDMRLLAAHDVQGAALLYPAWAPDASRLYVTHQARRAGGGVDMRIDRVDARSSVGQTVIANAAYPGPSHDGRLLAYASAANPDGTGQSLWIAAVDGSHAHQLLPAGVFVRYSSLRFAPDDQRLLFAAVGQGRAYAPPLARLLDPLGLLWRLAGGGVTYADGEEWDLWTIEPNGAGLHRLTNIAEDLPIASWSPTGEHIAFLGGGSARTAETGLVIMSADGGDLRRLTSRPGHRGADWTR